MAQDVYNSGSGTWTCPSGVYFVKVECWGGGGAGGYGGGPDTQGGAGGGGGAYASSIIAVVPGTNYAYSVGAAAGDSSFGTTLVVAKGGSNASGQTNGAGGLASASTGQIKYNGGSGVGSIVNSVSISGGGAGGPDGAGNNGAWSAAGGSGDAGSGGAGGATGTPGAAGSAHARGGGGGGAGQNNTTGGAGGAPGGAGGGGEYGAGAGAAGRVQISYSEGYASVYLDDIAVFNRNLTASEVSTLWTNGGAFLRYTNSLGSETLLSTVSNGTGNGGVYYNNYIYLMTNTTVARYGPLDGTPAYTASFWVTTLSKTALNNKIYPSINGALLPNHVGHVHGDNAMYFCDTLNGQGIIHKIKTKKVTSEGDTDDGSTYNALDLPFGFFPTDIESYGTDLAILSIQTTDTDANQGRSALFLWDTVSDTFYAGPIWIPDPLATAMFNVNGTIMIWSGTARQGCRLSKYLGGVQITDILIIEEACPPFAGATVAEGSRIYWGGFTVHPISAGVVYSWGSKDSRINPGLHIPIKSTSDGTSPNVTALAQYSQVGFARTKIIVGWTDQSSNGLDKVSSTATFENRFRSLPFSINKKFKVASLRVPLGATLVSGISITPTIYIDDESLSVPLTEINSTNFSGRKALYKDNHLQEATGENNFFVEFQWAGTVECPIKFPIEIEIETFDNEETT